MKYEWTITLKPFVYNLSAKEQAQRFRPILLEMLEDTQASAVLEVSREHNVHAHCIIELIDHKSRDRLLNRARRHKICGRRPINPVSNEPAYREYMRKDLKETRDIIDANPIVKDDFAFLGDLCKHGFQDPLNDGVQTAVETSVEVSAEEVRRWQRDPRFE